MKIFNFERVFVSCGPIPESTDTGFLISEIFNLVTSKNINFSFISFILWSIKDTYLNQCKLINTFIWTFTNLNKKYLMFISPVIFLYIWENKYFAIYKNYIKPYILYHILEWNAKTKIYQNIYKESGCNTYYYKCNPAYKQTCFIIMSFLYKSSWYFICNIAYHVINLVPCRVITCLSMIYK